MEQDAFNQLPFTPVLYRTQLPYCLCSSNGPVKSGHHY